MHAVNRLYRYRKSLSTTEFKARGHRVIRCEQCRVSKDFCLCSFTPNAKSKVSFLLLMYDTEVLKPSNSGRLIADVIPNTHAYIWSRTEPNSELLSLLADDKYQPYIVFPKQYALDTQKIIEHKVIPDADKIPLFIMLDGSWREAKKMFRKSPYLAKFPVVSFDPELMANGDLASRYHIRKAADNHQLATAEVAARVLEMAGEQQNAELLDLWFDVFSYQYQLSVRQTNKGNKLALQDYVSFTKEHNIELGNMVKQASSE